jgi:hypothetical protein
MDSDDSGVLTHTRQGRERLQPMPRGAIIRDLETSRAGAGSGSHLLRR